MLHKHFKNEAEKCGSKYKYLPKSNYVFHNILYLFHDDGNVHIILMTSMSQTFELTSLNNLLLIYFCLNNNSH